MVGDADVIHDILNLKGESLHAQLTECVLSHMHQLATGGLYSILKVEVEHDVVEAHALVLSQTGTLLSNRVARG